MNFKHPLAIVAAAAFVIGAGAGNATATPTVGPTVTPAPVVQPTAEIVTNTITRTETLEVTPQSCLDALDLAEDFAAYSTGVVNAVRPVIESMGGSTADQIDAMQTSTAKVKALNDQYATTADEYATAAAACRSR